LDAKGYILLVLVLVMALLLFVTNLLASIAKETLVPHKIALVRVKGRLALLGGIAKSLLVKGEPLATQAPKQVVLTTIGLA